MNTHRVPQCHSPLRIRQTLPTDEDTARTQRFSARSVSARSILCRHITEQPRMAVDQYSVNIQSSALSGTVQGWRSIIRQYTMVWSKARPCIWYSVNALAGLYDILRKYYRHIVRAASIRISQTNRYRSFPVRNSPTPDLKTMLTLGAGDPRQGLPSGRPARGNHPTLATRHIVTNSIRSRGRRTRNNLC